MLGIKYTGFFDAYSGMGNACRNYIHALATTGIPLTTELAPNLSTTFDLGAPHKTAQYLHGKNINYNIKILHVTPDMILKYLEPMKYHIAHFFWETDKLPPQHVWALNLVDEIWTGSEWSKKVFKKSGVKTPIYVFPQPVETNKDVPKFHVVNKPDFMFYSIFQWIERKNPRGLLEAYWKEFEGDDNVGLMIKTYKEKFTAEERLDIINTIRDWKKELQLSHYPQVHLYTEIMTKDDVLKFHSTGDAFVSAHRGEGWGVPIAEAMSLRKPVIATNLGGVCEYIPTDLWYPVDYRIIPIFNMEWIPFYLNDQKWARPTESDLRAKMRAVYENKDLAKETAKKAQKFVEKNMSFEAVGKLLKERLESIQ